MRVWAYLMLFKFMTTQRNLDSVLWKLSAAWFSLSAWVLGFHSIVGLHSIHSDFYVQAMSWNIRKKKEIIWFLLTSPILFFSHSLPEILLFQAYWTQLLQLISLSCFWTFAHAVSCWMKFYSFITSPIRHHFLQEVPWLFQIWARWLSWVLP